MLQKPFFFGLGQASVLDCPDPTKKTTPEK